MKRLLPILMGFALLLLSSTEGWTADFQKGMDAYKSGDYATAMSEWKSLAEQGDADAPYNLGLMYEEGKGVIQNYKTAVKWYTLGAERGDAFSQKKINKLLKLLENLDPEWFAGEIAGERKRKKERIAREKKQKKDASEMLQRGHRMNRNGNIDAAIEFYKKSLAIRPGYFAAKSSLKTALKQKTFLKLLEKVEPVCRKSAKDMEVQKLCLQKHFFFGGRPIHPKIIEEFNTGLSDTGDQVVAINIEDSQGSNRYCCTRDVEVKIFRDGEVYAKIDFKKDGWFSYRFHGTTDNGVYLIRIWDNGGGSGVFSSLLFLRIREVYSLKKLVARELLQKKTESILNSGKKRIHLEKLGSILLGDREKHTITVDGNFLILDGKKIGVPSL